MGFHPPIENYYDHIIVRGMSADHRGVDIGWSMTNGQKRVEKLLAVEPGVIVAEGFGRDVYGAWITAEESAGRITAATAAAYRNEIICWLRLDSNGWIAKYGHCASTDVSKGQRVAKGQVLGMMGTTGLSTGNHLHLEINTNNINIGQKGYVDFRPYLDPRPSVGSIGPIKIQNNEPQKQIIMPIEEANAKLAEKDAAILQRNNLIAEKDALLAQKEQELITFKHDLTEQFKTYQTMKEDELKALNDKVAESQTKVQDLQEKLAAGAMDEQDYDTLIEGHREDIKLYQELIDTKEAEKKELEGTIKKLEDEVSSLKASNEKWNALDENVRTFIAENPEIVEIAKNPQLLKAEHFKQFGGSALMYAWKKWGKQHYLAEALQKVITFLGSGGLGLVTGKFALVLLAIASVPMPATWETPALVFWVGAVVVAIIGGLQGKAHTNKNLEHTLKILNPAVDIYKNYLTKQEEKIYAGTLDKKSA